MLGKILEKTGYKYEELTKDERATLQRWSDGLTKNPINVAKIKEYLVLMRDAVELKLTETSHNSKQDLFLKARLKNYMLLEAFLAGPEKAKQAIEQAIANIPKKA